MKCLKKNELKENLTIVANSKRHKLRLLLMLVVGDETNCIRKSKKKKQNRFQEAESCDNLKGYIDR